jgi:trimeric autotransporter adhesin
MKYYRHLYLFLLVLCAHYQGFSQQSLGINTPNPDPSAALDVSATNKGMLIPRITFANRPANPATGLLIYQTDNTPGFYYYDGSMWKFISAGNGNNGTVTNVTATAPITVTNGSTMPQISLSKADSTTNGYLSNVDWKSFNKKYTLPSFNKGSILFSDSVGIAQNNSKLFWDNTTNFLGVGLNNPSKTLDVSGAGGLRVTSSNPGYSTNDWIAGNFGGQLNDRVVMGILNGKATI